MSDLDKKTTEEFDSAWSRNAVLGLLGIDQETAEVLWNVAYAAGWRDASGCPPLEVEKLCEALEEHHLFAQLRSDGAAYRESDTYRKTTAALAPFLASDGRTEEKEPK